MEKNQDQNPTTVRLTENAQAIKDNLSPVFGLKNILSAGLLLFDRLSSDDQKKLITEANIFISESPRAQIQKIKDMVLNMKGADIRLLSEAESRELQKLRAALSPEPKEQIKKRKKG